MGKHSVDTPLLCRDNPSPNYAKRVPFFIPMAKWVLKFLMWVVFIIWVSLMFLFPSETGRNLFGNWVLATNGTVFGKTGSVFIAFSGPVFTITCLGVLYLIISREEEVEEKKIVKGPSFRLWTFPVLVDGPFGVVSAAEFIGILLFGTYVIWAVSTYATQEWRLVSHSDLLDFLRSSLMWEKSGLHFGQIGLFCLAFLFLPISRGSVLLRLIDIPFEHATRYHVWLGHLTMSLFTLHGVFYITAWAMEGQLVQKILEWKDDGVANFAGVISLSAGLLMWITSLNPTRKKCFELFFYTHQLYLVFVVFLVLHVGDFIFSVAAGGIFLFMLDRFLRFCQSRKTTGIISATSLPCGTMELVLSKPANLRYNSLSFIFLQVREISWLQWHPFSVSSSPLDGRCHVSVVIKVLGDWTKKLRAKICDAHSKDEKDPKSPFQSQLTASVEGPYGHESLYHLEYEHIILVAGGIGISPFLAILSDILRRLDHGKPCMAGNISIVWAIRSSNELPLLSMLNMESICPFLADKLNLEFQIHVTRESEPLLEEGKTCESVKYSFGAVSEGSRMSSLVGSGNKFWSGIYVVSSITGFVFFLGLLDVYYINPFDISTWWLKGLLLLSCMVASVVIIGGAVASLWHLWETKIVASKEKDYASENDDAAPQTMKMEQKYLLESNHHLGSTKILYGCRPDFKEILGCMAERWGDVNIGVLVCGPPSMESSVAKEIRYRNLCRQRRHPIFHFHSHSFDL
ncbi:hypothetical protein Dimus_012995 [Dionaea muscipula]